MEGFNLVPVPFREDKLWAGRSVDKDGEVLVAVKPISENLGLDWRGQRQRVLRTPILAKGVVIMTTPSPGGEQETTCLPMKLIPGWLFGIDVTRVKPELRERLTQYQEECFGDGPRRQDGSL